MTNSTVITAVSAFQQAGSVMASVNAVICLMNKTAVSSFYCWFRLILVILAYKRGMKTDTEKDNSLAERARLYVC